MRTLIGMTCRWLIILTVVSSAFTGFALCIVYPQGWVFYIGLAAAGIAGKQHSGWVHGMARWATPDEVCGGTYGLIVGKIEGLSVREAFRGVMRSSWRGAYAACEALFAAMGRREMWVTLDNFVHTLVVAGVGAGKTQAVVIPFLLNTRRTCFVNDIKGEVFAKTAAFRRKVFGHRIILLDPMGVTGQRSDTFNVLDTIDGNSENAPDETRALARDIIEHNPEAHDPHWESMAVLMLWGVMLLVVCSMQGKYRNLTTVADILSNAKVLGNAIKGMQEMNDYGGSLRRIGNQLGYLQDKELNSVMTTVTRSLAFLNSPAMARHTDKSSFDPKLLIAPNTTTYMVLPPHLLVSHRAYPRLMVGTVCRLLSQRGVANASPVVMVLDESAALGKIESLENAIVQLRGYGLRTVNVWQSVNQIDKCFEDQRQTYLANMDTQVFFGINDFDTADLVHKNLGMFTAESGTTNRGWNTGGSHSGDGGVSTSWGDNGGYSRAEVERPLMRPEEILRMSNREAIVLRSGAHPLRTRLVRAYEPEFTTRRNTQTAFGMLVKSLVACAASIALMVVAVAATQKESGHGRTEKPLPRQVEGGTRKARHAGASPVSAGGD